MEKRGVFMLKDQVLKLLYADRLPLSGEGISSLLGVSRAAVWKAIQALRADGYTIEALPGRGYRLTQAPDVLTAAELSRPTPQMGCQVVCLDTVVSTNNTCKDLAAKGAPTGLVVTAEEQTGGKGRRGRSFQSLGGKGLYLSALLRPQAPLEQVSRLTAWTAVAVCRAVEALTGLSPQIKWTNDILLDGKKLCGILTELSLEGESGALDYVVVGIGVNVSQTAADFGPELSPIATSLGRHMAAPPRRAEIAAAILTQLEEIRAGFPQREGEYLAEYRRRCITVGREVLLLQGDRQLPAQALGINDDFSLQVRLSSGEERAISAGEVSVRGLLGYA